MIVNSRARQTEATLRGRLNLGAPEETAWMRDGLCAQTDPEAFYPEPGRSTAPAKAVCQACPVRSECLDYALARGERFGVWGGTSERERRKMRRRAAAAAAAAADRWVA